MDLISNFATPTSVTVIVVACFTIYICRTSLNELVRKIIVNYKGKGVEVTSKEQSDFDTDTTAKQKMQIAKLYKDLDEARENQKSLKENRDLILELWKYYMFSFFNLHLVINTKNALLWLYNNPNVTKYIYKANILTAPQVVDIDQEKEAIFNALVANNLISKNSNNLYTITNIGIDFLKFINLI